MSWCSSKPEEIEAHLGTNPYLSEGGLPGPADAKLYLELKAAPEVGKYPNTHYWYLFIGSFSNDLLKKWSEKAVCKKAEEKKEPAKKADLEDDLFDDAPAAEVKPKPKPAPPAAKKDKPKAIAKSIVVFDVKVYEQETDLDVLAKKILERKIEGLTWNNEPKKLQVAYGIQKLQMGCVIEDEKVLTDDIFEPIEEWEEVQSVDMVSMQKL